MIIFRGHLKKDIPLRVKWLNNKKATRFAVENYKHITTFREQKKWFNDYKKNPQKKFFTICDNNLPIGFMGLSNIDKTKRTADVFIMIGEDEYRGRGVGMKAIKYLVSYAFKNLKLKLLSLEVNRKNLPAINLYKKVGFKETEKTTDKEIIMRLGIDNF